MSDAGAQWASAGQYPAKSRNILLEITNIQWASCWIASYGTANGVYQIIAILESVFPLYWTRYGRWVLIFSGAIGCFSVCSQYCRDQHTSELHKKTLNFLKITVSYFFVFFYPNHHHFFVNSDHESQMMKCGTLCPHCKQWGTFLTLNSLWTELYK